MKLWEGRFAEGTDKIADVFNESLSFDKVLYAEDIKGSIAHATMLGQENIIDKTSSDHIVEGLKSILTDIESGRLIIEGAEDIHTFVEQTLVKRIGDEGKKLHTGRSRNDQVATDFKLYVKSAGKKISGQIKTLVEELIAIAEKNIGIYMPGYTHLRKAQPVSVAHYLNAYSEMFMRDIDRFVKSCFRGDFMPLGSGALAGTSYPINRSTTAELLGFGGVTENSLDGVSDRDFVCEFLFNCAMTSMHLSRFSEELILFTSDEFGFMEISDAFSTGSSIMPQKKNPDIPELIRGKTGRFYGNLMGMLTALKGIPLAYNKDLQEDKEAVVDSFTQLSLILDTFTAMLSSITFNTKVMSKAAEGGFSAATDVADYLAKKGLPFRDAHAVTGAIVRECIKNKTTLQKLSAEEYKSYSPLFDDDITEVVKIKNVVEARKAAGGTAKPSVQANLKSLKKRLSSYHI